MKSQGAVDLTQIIQEFDQRHHQPDHDQSDRRNQDDENQWLKNPGGQCRVHTAAGDEDFGRGRSAVTRSLGRVAQRKISPVLQVSQQIVSVLPLDVLFPLTASWPSVGLPARSVDSRRPVQRPAGHQAGGIRVSTQQGEQFAEIPPGSQANRFPQDREFPARCVRSRWNRSPVAMRKLVQPSANTTSRTMPAGPRNRCDTPRSSSVRLGNCMPKLEDVVEHRNQPNEQTIDDSEDEQHHEQWITERDGDLVAGIGRPAGSIPGSAPEKHRAVPRSSPSSTRVASRDGHTADLLQCRIEVELARFDQLHELLNCPTTIPAGNSSAIDRKLSIGSSTGRFAEIFEVGVDERRCLGGRQFQRDDRPAATAHWCVSSAAAIVSAVSVPRRGRPCSSCA